MAFIKMLTAERKECQFKNEHNILFLETNNIIKQEGIFCIYETGCFFLTPLIIMLLCAWPVPMGEFSYTLPIPCLLQVPRAFSRESAKWVQCCGCNCPTDFEWSHVIPRIK